MKNRTVGPNKNQELDRYKNALRIINFELIELFKYLDSIKKIFDFYIKQASSLQEYESLFYEIQKTFKDQAVLSLSNIIIDDRESINFFYLSRYYHSTARKYYSEDDDSNIRDSIQKIVKNLDLEMTAVNNIKCIRDKFIAHCDKQTINSEKLKCSISLDDLERVGGIIFREITKINFFSGIGNEMWDFTYSFGICSDIDKILNANDIK